MTDRSQLCRSRPLSPPSAFVRREVDALAAARLAHGSGTTLTNPRVGDEWRSVARPAAANGETPWFKGAVEGGGRGGGAPGLRQWGACGTLRLGHCLYV